MFKSTVTIVAFSLIALTASGKLALAQDKQQECLDRANYLCNDAGPAGSSGHTNCVNIEFHACMMGQK